MFLRIFLLFSIFYENFSLKKFTIHSEGKNIITSKVSNQGECTSIAITQEGRFIKYKSDSSIISYKDYEDLKTEFESNYFMCQYNTNNIILIRDKEIIKFTLDGNGNINSDISKSNFVYSIISLQCNNGLYIITYFTDNTNKNYKFEVYSSSSLQYQYQYNSNIADSSFISSSCILIDDSNVLCINALENEIKYFYYKKNSASVTLENSGNINIENNIKINGALIKYWSNNEILLCINANTITPISDINLLCYMLNIEINNNNIQLTSSNSYTVNEQITKEIDYCQIEKLYYTTQNIYVSICLTYYKRTTYLLSIFSYDNNEFSQYNNNDLNYKDINFPLLYKTSISITSFEKESFGIFFKDIDNDSMILMFYPKCTNEFDYAPKGSNCYKIGENHVDLNGYYYDECTHSFMEIPARYSVYERNQFCKIKKIKCENSFKLVNFGNYQCWEKSNPPPTYYYDSSSSLFKKCFRTCLTCNGQGDESDNNCISCKENFYKLPDRTSQCHHKDEPLNYYYFDSSNKEFKKCREECLTCTELGSIQGDDIDTKCTKCLINEDYYPQVDKISNCIKNTNTIKYYYFFESYKTWEKCFDGCLYCNELGTSIYDTKCKENSCSEGYYTTVDNPKNCFNKNIRYDNYYFNSENNKFEKCYEACLQCDESGDSYNTKCIKCKESENYYPKEDDSSMCLKHDASYSDEDSLPEKYYYDPNTKTFRRCQEGCLKCKEQINANENDTQCLSCDTLNDYYPLDNEISNCFSKNKKGYYFDESVSKIKKCPEGCISCIYDSSATLKIKCKECDNELRFYQLEEKDIYGNIIDPVYKDCRTLRGEKILTDLVNSPYNQAPPLNTILSNHTFIRNGISTIVPIFKYCANACTKCTGLYESELKTHCQAKQCNSDYTYILNYEDICYLKTKKLQQYFLDTEKNIFMPCYETCETCSKSGNKQNNNCLSCRAGFKFHPYKKSHSNNCVFDCLATNNYFYLDEENNDEYTCVDECPEKYPYLQPNNKQCLKSCSNEEVLKYSRDWICVSECPLGTKSNDFEECVTVSNNCIKSELESNYLLNDINDENVNEFIVNYCRDYSFTSQQISVIENKLKEYKIYIYKNKDCINEFFKNEINFPNLSVCFNELKSSNNINENQDLIIMIMNIYNNTSSIRVEYKIFESVTCKELDLNNCSIKNISTNINLNNYFSENQIQTAQKLYDKGIIVYNRTHPFFTDICYEFNSYKDRDIILEDRVDDFYQDVSQICENNCKYDVDFEQKILKCICELKTTFLSNNTEEEKKKNLGFGVGPISVEVVKCTKKAFLWKYFKDNIGSYTSLVLIFAEIPVIFCFFKFGLSQVKIFLIPFLGANPPKQSLINKNGKKESSKNNNKEIINEINNEEEEIEEENEIDSNNMTNNNNENKISNFENISNKNKTDKKEEEITNLNKSLKENSDKNSNDSLLENQSDYQRKKIKKKNYDIYKEIKDYDDLNDVELFDAITFDKRKFCQFYWDELKRTQPIIYSFIVYTPLTPKYFKILLFIFNTIICFELNAFFYSKQYISDKYRYFYNEFSWYINHIYDRIIYTCICTVFLNLLLRVFTSYKKKIQMWIKRENDQEKLNKEIIIMKIKFQILKI